VIWDLCHYGWPDHLSIWSPAFPQAFAAFAEAAALFLRDQGVEAPFWCPVNEISYWAWAGGQVKHIGPYAWGRGPALKRQLVRATNLAIEALRRVDPACRIVLVDPLIHVVPDRPRDRLAADRTRLWMYEAWDLIGGRTDPRHGGHPSHLDIIGVNFYSNNQRLLSGPEITPDHPGWKPFRFMLLEIWQRYRRPILVAETGADGEVGAAWLSDVCAEVRAAMELGVEIVGVCIYPVMDYPGWVDHRHCPCGPIQAAAGFGPRRFYPPMAAAVLREEAAFAAFAQMLAGAGPRSG